MRKTLIAGNWKMNKTAAEAVALVALLEAYGARPRAAAATDTAALVIEQGFLGRPALT